MDLRQVLGIIEGALGTTRGLQGTASSAFGQEQQGITTAGQARQQQILNEGIVAMEQARGQMQAESNSRRFAAELGTNMDEPNEILTMIARQARQHALNAAKEVDNVAKMESRSDLFGNPAGFIYDLLYGDGERAKRDAALNAADQQTKLLNALNASTTTAAQTQNALKRTVTDASLAAQQEAINAMGEVALGEMQKDLAGASYRYINSLSSLNSQEVAQAAQAYNMVVQSEQRAAAQAQKELTEELRRQTLEDKLEAAKTRKERSQAEADFINYYNQGVETAGTGIPVSNMEQLRVQMQINKPAVDTLINLGARTVRLGGDPATAPLAVSPYEALNVMSVLQPELNDMQKMSVRAMMEAADMGITDEAIANYIDPTADTAAKRALISEQIKATRKDPEVMNMLRASALEAKVASDAAVQKPGDYKNIYAPADLDAYLDKPYAQQNKWFQDYVVPHLTEDSVKKVFDLDWLTDRGIEGMKSGEVTSTEVADMITWLSNQAIGLNNGTRLYHKRLGVPAQSSLKQPVTVKGAGLFEANMTTILDGTDFQDVVTVLNRKLDADTGIRKSRQIFEAFHPFQLR